MFIFDTEFTFIIGNSGDSLKQNSKNLKLKNIKTNIFQS